MSSIVASISTFTAIASAQERADTGSPCSRAELARVNVAPTRNLTLTPSERRVAELAASGMTNRDIAAALFISPKTVEANLARVYRKLGIRTRAELGRHIGTDSDH